MSRRGNFDSGHNKPEHTIEHEDLGGGDNVLQLYTPSYDKHYPAASVSYTKFQGDAGPTVEVEYLKSHQEGKGHARALMNELYSKYPEHIVNWGFTIHPAATHLAEQFAWEHPTRTDYIENHEDEDGW